MKGCAFSDIYLAPRHRSIGIALLSYLYSVSVKYANMCASRMRDFYDEITFTCIYPAFVPLIMFYLRSTSREGAGNKKVSNSRGYPSYRSTGLRFHLINSIQIQFPAAITMFFSRAQIDSVSGFAQILLRPARKMQYTFPQGLFLPSAQHRRR